MAAKRRAKAKPATPADWPASDVVQRPVAVLTPYENNPRTHSKAQIGQIAASIEQWGWTTPVLIDEDEQILAGHGRVQAAKQMGLQAVPCVIAEGWTDAQKRAYVIADNQLALNAGWDAELLAVEMQGIEAAGFDAPLVGFSDAELERLRDPEWPEVEPPEPGADGYREQFGVMVICSDEADQRAVYEQAENAFGGTREVRVVTT